MEPFRDDQNLIAELRELRPEPSQDFAAELDERAAAGFPRRSSRANSPWNHFLARLRATEPRRALIPAGAFALVAIAVATVVIAVNQPKSDSTSLVQLSPNKHISAGRPGAGGGVRAGGDTGVQYETAAPAITRHSAMPKESSAALPSSGAGGIASAGSSSETGPYASKAGPRDVERSAGMVLGADPDEVAGDAAAVFDAVHAVNGIVLSSSITGGTEGDAGARFDLLIPAAKLSDALAAFSAIDIVVSRHEATDDITAPTVRTGEHLRDSRATIDGLLVQLAGADSDEERAEVELELRAERRHAAALRSQAAKLDRRANLSRVSLRIVTDPALTSSAESGGGWSVSDALGDAGQILAIAAGVTIVGLAILGPLALIALLAWLANHARLRRARERALA